MDSYPEIWTTPGCERERRQAGLKWLVVLTYAARSPQHPEGIWSDPGDSSRMSFFGGDESKVGLAGGRSNPAPPPPWLLPSSSSFFIVSSTVALSVVLTGNQAAMFVLLCKASLPSCLL